MFPETSSTGLVSVPYVSLCLSPMLCPLCMLVSMLVSVPYVPLRSLSPIFPYIHSSSTSLADAYVVLGDDNTIYDNGAIFFMASDNGSLEVVTGGSAYSCGPYNPFTWYRIGFNVDWACQAFDVYVDGALKQFNLPFRTSSVVEFTQLHVLDFHSSIAWWDQITMSTPPPGMLIFVDLQ
jgi:hypothetical protein